MGIGLAVQAMGFLLLLQGKPQQALELGTSDRNGRDLWKTHAITSAFEKEQDISWQVSEKDLRTAREDNTQLSQ